MSISILADNVVTLIDTTERVDIIVQDILADPPVNIDPWDIKLTVTDVSGTTVMYDSWPLPNRRIVRSAVGEFYVDLGPPTAELTSNHSIGASVLTILDAVPAVSISWPPTGSITIDYGDPDRAETVNYTSTSIVGGVGTITLATPLVLAHTEGAYVKGPLRETDSVRELLFDWRVQLAPSSQIVHTIQKITIVSYRIMSFVPELRLLIDKSRKVTAPESNCFLGYTDSQLISFLQGGLQHINAYQPSLTLTIENYPIEYKQVLIDAALISGVMSQQLYAIDTDIPNYNDQGTSFVITHQQQLAGFLNQVTARLDRLIPMMKLQLIQPGSLHIQMGPSFRLQTLMSAAPSGSIFRNVFFKG